MPGELAAMVEPFAVGVGSVRRSHKLQGANVAVVGAGTIGNFTAQAAKHLGAAKVLVTDVNQAKLDYALECGIDAAVNTKNTTLKEAIAATFGVRKADVIIDCAGSPFTFKAIMEAARPSSEVIITANFKEPVEFNVPVLQRQEITLLGHMMYVREDFQTAIELLASGRIVTSKTVTKVFGFDEYEEAFKYADADPDSVMKLIIKL
jgi:L-iditol 2-dehydrogenase